MVTPDYIRAHRHSSRHRHEVLTSDRCGCFYCLSIFQPDRIEDWTDEWQGEGKTALCPHCGIDAVIGSESGYPMTEAFLRQMNSHWFS